MSLTGIKDLDLLILEKSEERDLISMMFTNWANYNLCQLIYKRKLEDKFPTFLKYKDGEKTYFSYHKFILDSIIHREVDDEEEILKHNWLLQYYMRDGNLIFVKFLIEKGVKWTNFDFFVYIDDINMIKFLLEKYKNEINDPLLKYLENGEGNLEIVKYLVEECGEEISKDVIISVIINDYLDVLKYFIEVRKIPFNKTEYLHYENYKNVNVMNYISTLQFLKNFSIIFSI